MVGQPRESLCRRWFRRTGDSPALAYLNAEQPARRVRVLLVVAEPGCCIVEEGWTGIEEVHRIHLQQRVLEEAAAEDGGRVPQLGIESREGAHAAVGLAGDVPVMILEVNAERGTPMQLLPGEH